MFRNRLSLSAMAGGVLLALLLMPGTPALARPELHTVALAEPAQPDPDASRSRSTALPFDAALPAKALPSAGVALDALQDALLNLNRGLVEVGAAAQHRQVIDLLQALENTARGSAVLPEAALCLADRGLPKLLNEVDAKSNASVAIARDALVAVCAQSAAFADAPESSVSDPFATDRLATGNALEKDSWYETLCAKVGVRTPDMTGVNPFFGMDGFKLSPNSNTATLEEGNKIAVRSLCAPWTSGMVTNSYGASVSLTYTPAGGASTTVVLDSFVGDGEVVAFPTDLRDPTQSAAKSATLRYQTVRKACTFGLCSYTLLGAETSQALRIERLGEMCTLNYRYKHFALNDRNPVAGEFMHTYVNALNLDERIAWSSNTFKAYGRTSTLDLSDPMNPFVSSFPAYNPVVDSAQFVVHRDDHLSLFDPNIPRGLSISQVGATQLSGLRFPRVVGTNFLNEQPYSYTCAPPKIVRDVVAFCTWIGKPADSMYQLPYHGARSTFRGNNGDSSHSGVFAYDFRADMGAAVPDKVFAARAGRVTGVIDWKTENCPFGGCTANQVWITHQDGSVALYMHFRYLQVAVKTNDIVPRGAYLGAMGATGWAWAEHVHFQATDTDNINALALFDDQSGPCVEPKGPFDYLTSTLTPGQNIELKYLSHPQLATQHKR